MASDALALRAGSIPAASFRNPPASGKADDVNAETIIWRRSTRRATAEVYAHGDGFAVRVSGPYWPVRHTCSTQAAAIALAEALTYTGKGR